MERFSESENGVDRLTVTEAEAIARRFTEREEAFRREQERLAAMATADELAQTLGTTPEDVIALTEEIRVEADRRRIADAQEQAERAEAERRASEYVRPGFRTRWVVAVALIALLFFAGAFLKSAQRRTVPVSSAWPAVEAANRQRLREAMHQETVLNDPSIVPPPRGLRVSLLTFRGKLTAVGQAGPVAPGTETVDRLRRCIESLVRYEEATPEFRQNLPVSRWLHDWSVYYGPNPDLYDSLGFRFVQVTSADGTATAQFLDTRYGNRSAQWVANSLQGCVDRLADAKFIPGSPPGGLRSDAVQIGPIEGVPRRVCLTLYAGERQVWARGASDGYDSRAFQKALTTFATAAAKRLPDLSTLPRSAGGEAPDYSLRTTYPAGEEWTYGGRPVNSADPRSSVSFPADKVSELVEVVSGRLENGRSPERPTQGRP